MSSSSDSDSEEESTNHVEVTVPGPSGDAADAKQKDGFKWNHDLIVSLIQAVGKEAQSSAFYQQPFDQLPLDWDTIAANISIPADKAEAKWNAIMKGVRHYRTMGEIVSELLTSNQYKQEIVKLNRAEGKNSSTENIPSAKSTKTSTTTRKAKPKVNPLHPKKPLGSGYMLFCAERIHDPDIKALESRLRMKTLGSTWTGMPSTEKDKYHQQLVKRRKAYEEEVKVYAKQHPEDEEIKKTLQQLQKTQNKGGVKKGKESILHFVNSPQVKRKQPADGPGSPTKKAKVDSSSDSSSSESEDAKAAQKGKATPQVAKKPATPTSKTLPAAASKKQSSSSSSSESEDDTIVRKATPSKPAHKAVTSTKKAESSSSSDSSSEDEKTAKKPVATPKVTASPVKKQTAESSIKKKSQVKDGGKKGKESSQDSSQNLSMKKSQGKDGGKKGRESSQDSSQNLSMLTDMGSLDESTLSWSLKSPKKKKKKKKKSLSPKKRKRMTGQDMFVETKFDDFKVEHPDMEDDYITEKLKRKFNSLSKKKQVSKTGKWVVRYTTNGTVWVWCS